MILLFLVSITVFSVLFVLPGDPAQIILGINATPETLENLRSQLGLNQPFMAQYLDWIGNLLSGEGNRSINYDIPVSELIISRLKVTGPLALMAMCFAILLSIPLGIYAAQHQNRPTDVMVMFFTQIGLATPDFWLGMLLILLMAVKLFGLRLLQVEIENAVHRFQCRRMPICARTKYTGIRLRIMLVYSPLSQT